MAIIMRVCEVINNGAEILSTCSFIAHPRLEARLLLASACICSSNELIMQTEKTIDAKQLKTYLQHIKERSEGKSIAGITKEKGFYDLVFQVNNQVLIPRPETEMLVEFLIKKATKHQWTKGIDLCAGPGTIGLTLLKHLSWVYMELLELSDAAVALIERNAFDFAIEKERFVIRHENVLHWLPECDFDFIVSNPPYIRSEVVDELYQTKQLDDPRISLEAGNDGLLFYEYFAKALQNVQKRTFVAFEHGYDQKEILLELFAECGGYDFECIKDYDGHDRIISFYMGHS